MVTNGNEEHEAVKTWSSGRPLFFLITVEALQQGAAQLPGAADAVHRRADHHLLIPGRLGSAATAALRLCPLRRRRHEESEQWNGTVEFRRKPLAYCIDGGDETTSLSADHSIPY